MVGEKIIDLFQAFMLYMCTSIVGYFGSARMRECVIADQRRR